MKTRSGNSYEEERTLIKSKNIRKRKEIKLKKLKKDYVRREIENNLMNATECRLLDLYDELREVALPADESIDDIIDEQPPKKSRKMGEHLNKIEKLKLDGNLSNRLPF